VPAVQVRNTCPSPAVVVSPDGTAGGVRSVGVAVTATDGVDRLALSSTATSVYV